MRSFVHSSLVALSFFVFSAVANAGTPVPINFSAGSAAKAADVNADFAALAARLDKLEGTTALVVADLAGTYQVQYYTTSIGNYSPIAYNTNLPFKVDSTVGTVTLVADGTGTWSTTYTGAYLQPTGSNGILNLVNYGPTSSSFSFTWTLSGQTLTTTPTISGVPCTLSIGGRICLTTGVDTVNNPVGTAVSSFIMMRTN
jgi:hypothetical protein